MPPQKEEEGEEEGNWISTCSLALLWPGVWGHQTVAWDPCGGAGRVRGSGGTGRNFWLGKQGGGCSAEGQPLSIHLWMDTWLVSISWLL